MKINIATILQHISENFLIHSLQCDKLLIASNFQLKHMVFRQSIQNSVICSFFAISESDTLFLKLLFYRLLGHSPHLHILFLGHSLQVLIIFTKLFLSFWMYSFFFYSSCCVFCLLLYTSLVSFPFFAVFFTQILSFSSGAIKTFSFLLLLTSFSHFTSPYFGGSLEGALLSEVKSLFPPAIPSRVLPIENCFHPSWS